MYILFFNQTNTLIDFFYIFYKNSIYFAFLLYKMIYFSNHTRLFLVPFSCLFVVLGSVICQGQSPCKKMKKGHFILEASEYQYYIKRTKKLQYEYAIEQELFSIIEIEWIAPCTFSLQWKKGNLKSNIEKNENLVIQITRIVGHQYFYELSNLSGLIKENNQMRKISKKEGKKYWKQLKKELKSWDK